MTGGHLDRYGVVQSANTHIILTPAQWNNTVYQSGSGDDVLKVRASDGTLFSDTATVTVDAPLDQGPVISPIAANIVATLRGHIFTRPELFTASDPDGDTITQYELRSSGTGGGRWIVNNIVQPNQQNIFVTPTQLGQTVFASGPGADKLQVRASDGVQWGDWTPFTVTGKPDQAPVVTYQFGPPNEFTVKHHGDYYFAFNQSDLPHSLFTASDPDGDTITKYEVWADGGAADLIADPRSGDTPHWTIDGQSRPPGVFITLTPAQMANAAWHTGWATDHVWLRAFDGEQWGDWAKVTVHGALDTEAHVTLKSGGLTPVPGTLYKLSDLVELPAVDPDGDPITEYKLGSRGVWLGDKPAPAIMPGHWVLNGVIEAGTGALTGDEQPDNTPIIITPGEVDSVYYQTSADPRELTSRISIQANDGEGFGDFIPALGAFTTIFIDEPSNTGPTTTSKGLLTVGGLPAVQSDYFGQTFAATDLFAFSDPNGPTPDGYPITEYGLYQNAGGHWVVDGKAQPTDHSLTIPASELGVTYFQTDIPSHNPALASLVMMEAGDGVEFGKWSTMWILGVTPPVVTLKLGDAIVATHHDDFFFATNLFSAKDSDGSTDPVKYQLFSDGAGGGHWVVDGFAKPNDQAITITAAQLPQAYFQTIAGTGTDNLKVRAGDGSSTWEPWTNLAITAKADTAPLMGSLFSAVDGPPGDSWDASDLFTPSDPDGDIISKYKFENVVGPITDPAQIGGHWEVNGLAQAAGKAFTVTASDFLNHKVQYISGNGTIDTVYGWAYDGEKWSNFRGLTVQGDTTPTAKPKVPPVVHDPNLKPASQTTVVTDPADFTIRLNANQELGSGSVFKFKDIDGDSIQDYRLWAYDYSNGGGGGWYLNGSLLPYNQWNVLTPDQFAHTVYHAGTGPQDLYAEAEDVEAGVGPELAGVRVLINTTHSSSTAALLSASTALLVNYAAAAFTPTAHGDASATLNVPLSEHLVTPTPLLTQPHS